MDKTACAFTGHRPHRFPWKYNEVDPRCTALKTVMTDQIGALANSGVTSFFSGGAAGVLGGFDRPVSARKKSRSEAPLHPSLCGAGRRWNNSERERYHVILRQADSVDYASQDYYDGCMINRNHRLVESAGLLLAVYNGARRCGTGATVNYARKLGREIILINPVTLSMTHEGGKV